MFQDLRSGILFIYKGFVSWNMCFQRCINPKKRLVLIFYFANSLISALSKICFTLVSYCHFYFTILLKSLKFVWFQHLLYKYIILDNWLNNVVMVLFKIYLTSLSDLSLTCNRTKKLHMYCDLDLFVRILISRVKTQLILNYLLYTKLWLLLSSIFTWKWGFSY